MVIDMLDVVRTVVILLVLTSFIIVTANRYLRPSTAARLADSRTKGHGLPFPPGPKPLPLLGNILDLPRKHEWETFTKWGRVYGTCFSLFYLLE